MLRGFIIKLSLNSHLSIFLVDISYCITIHWMKVMIPKSTSGFALSQMINRDWPRATILWVIIFPIIISSIHLPSDSIINRNKNPNSVISVATIHALETCLISRSIDRGGYQCHSPDKSKLSLFRNKLLNCQRNFLDMGTFRTVIRSGHAWALRFQEIFYLDCLTRINGITSFSTVTFQIHCLTVIYISEVLNIS